MTAEVSSEEHAADSAVASVETRDDAWVARSSSAVASRGEDLSWVNVLAFALAAISLPVGLRLLVAPLMSLSAAVLGAAGVRAASRGEARFAVLGYVAIVFGLLSLGAIVWLLGPDVVTMLLNPERD